MTAPANPPVRDCATRTEDGPVVCHDAHIVSREDEGQYHRLVVAAPMAAARAVPGQFLTLDLGVSERILPRPFSIAGADADAGTLEVLFAEVGGGTQGFHQRARVGDVVRLVGPLGTGYTPADGPAVAVGGGYGAAPLTWLASTLPGAVDLVVGAATEARMCLPAAAHEVCREVHVTTDDGSVGTRGRVTDVLDEVLDASGATTVYACGPMPMLRAVEAVAQRRGVACQLATEEHMACGVGVCMTCVIPIRTEGGDHERSESPEQRGSWTHKRACIDGPVVPGGALAWEATRW